MMDANYPHEAGAKAKRPKRSRAKRNIQRPYLPPYVDREDIAYRLRVSIGTVDNWIKAGLLPEPVVIFGGLERWRWSDIEDAVEALNLLANDNEAGAPLEQDAFLEGLKRGSSADE